jgi:hypothetical protein
MRFAIFMINECIYNHPLKKFADENCELVGVLIGARGTKHDVHGIKIFVLKRYIVMDQH